MANNSFIRDLIEPVTLYLKENKPYHTKLAEVVQIFTHEDRVNVSFTESWVMFLTITHDRGRDRVTCPPAGFDIGTFAVPLYDEPGACDRFPDTVVHATFEETLELVFDSFITLNDRFNVFFCDTGPYDQDQHYYKIPGTAITSQIVRIDTQGALVDILNNTAPNQFHILGNVAGRFTFGTRFLIQGSAFNNKARHTILSVNNLVGPHHFVIAGSFAIKFRPGYVFTVTGSISNNGTYTVFSSTLAFGQTTVAVRENIPSSVADGVIEAHWMAETAYHDNTPTGTNTTVIKVREQIVDGSVVGSVILPSITIREYLNATSQFTQDEFEREGFDTCGYNNVVGEPTMFRIILNPNSDNIDVTMTDTGFASLPDTINGGGLLAEPTNTTFTDTIQFFVDTLTLSDTIGVSYIEDAEPIESS